LNESQELRLAITPGKAAYIWNRPPKVAMLGPDAAQVMRELDEKSSTTKRRPKR
jgi:hypothetical protein